MFSELTHVYLLVIYIVVEPLVNIAMCPSGVNAPGLPNYWFRRVGSVACRSLITVGIVVQYALRCTIL